MKVEILEDILNELADRLDIYGACKSNNEYGCFKNDNYCCRVCFILYYEDRIRDAIYNEEKIGGL